MRFYKAIIGLRQDMSNHDIENRLVTIKTLIEKLSGNILKIERWGTREMKTNSRRTPNVYFAIIDMKAPPSSIQEMEKYFSIHHAEIVKFMILKSDGVEEQETLL